METVRFSETSYLLQYEVPAAVETTKTYAETVY